MKRQLIFVLAIVVLLAASPIPAEVLYNVTDLGRGRALAINNTGQIVGHCIFHATLFDSTGGGNNIVLDEQDGVISYAFSINDSGQIVGNIEPSAGESRAVIFDPTGQGNHTYLSTPSGFSSWAYSINNNGQIVGRTVGQATLFDSTGVDDNTYLGSGLAMAINNNGQIVGRSYPIPGEPTRATLFDPTGDGNNIDLGTLGSRPSGAYSINNNGQIVGYALGMLGGDSHALLFDPTGQGNNIALGGGAANSINDSGQIVGGRIYIIAPMRSHAILFDSTGDGNNIDLNNLIDPNLGWELNSAECINNNGWIVGSGRNPDGEAHAYLLIPKPPTIYYVDADATGANDGSSWEDAFNYLQDALAVARSGDQIWVAEGFYKPDEDTANPSGTGDREATFQLINGVAIYGGYAGFGESDPNARNVELYETILSGDLDGNDVDVNYPIDLWFEPTRNENSYNVVTGSGTDQTAVLDGFTITAGNANGSFPQDVGGGMFNESGSPTLTNCTFSGNSAMDGGGMFNYEGSSPALTNCTFIGNSGGADGGGGGMANWGGSSPTVTNCTFSGNLGPEGGGGMWNGYDSRPTLTNCIFSGNSAGGGTNPTFYIGGGMLNCENTSPTLTNCAFAGNSAVNGNALACDSAEQQPYPSTVQLANCILWDGGDEIWNNDGSTITITYSDVQGGWPGDGNIDADPCFVELGYWDVNGVWVEGDYHLLRTSPCIDAANDANVYTDIEGNIRPFDFPGVDNNGELPDFDMGAYEATAEEAELMIFPRVINRRSRQRRIWAWVRLPEGVTRDQIDSNEPLLLYPDVPEANGIEAIRQFIFQNRRRRSQRTNILAFFDKDELMDAVGDDGRVELQVVGNLRTGQYFYGTDTVWITDWRRLRFLRHW